MPRGGARPGAGRKRGVPNRKTARSASRILLGGDDPLTIMLSAMRKLYQGGDFEAAARIAKDAAPYVHQKFTATQEPAQRHPEQKIQGELFAPVEAREDAPPDEWDGVLN